MKLFYSKLKVVGQTLMKTKIDFLLNGFCEFFLFLWQGGGGGDSKKTSFRDCQPAFC